MSRKKHESDPQEPEGWESLSEEAEGGSLAPNPELEEAMREAMEAVEARSDAPGGGGRESEETAELRDRLLRLQAEFENFRKRSLKEKEEAWRYGHQNLVKDLLPTVDNLERAIDHARSSRGGDLEGLLQGVELVRRELLGILEQHGLASIDPEGEPFDPTFHEAMAQQPDGSVPPNTVVQVFEKGYRLRDRMLRPARVVVSSRPAEAKESDE